ncbi:MAG TPA: hypothetical protein VK824_11360, partial [Planctomycetota bacterium]|nr:hypothetical protein [Planctomycetota bacterium]
PEFAWHTRLLWACLIRVDAGVGPPELEPLRGTFGRLNEAYEAARKRAGRDFPPLTEIIGTFPTPLLNEASALLVRDLDRVQRGLRFFGMDPQYMQPVSRMEDLQSLQLAPEDFAQHMDRRARHTDEMQGGHGDDDGNGGGYGASEGAGDGTGHHDGAGKSDAGQPAPAPGATEPAGAPVPLGKEPGASPAPAKPPKQDAPAEPDKPGGK